MHGEVSRRRKGRKESKWLERSKRNGRTGANAPDQIQCGGMMPNFSNAAKRREAIPSATAKLTPPRHRADQNRAAADITYWNVASVVASVVSNRETSNACSTTRSPNRRKKSSGRATWSNNSSSPDSSIFNTWSN